MSSPDPSQAVLGKRKREDDGDDDIESNLLVPDENNLSLVSFGSNLGIQEGVGHTASDEESEDQDSDSDDDVVNEHEARQPEHSESQEPFPDCAIYNKDLPSICAGLTSIPVKIVEILSQYDSTIGQIRSHLEAAQMLVDIPTTKKLRIGLVGDAGAGKSSTLNSLTDIMDLAKSLSGGQSCTCVPTEYSGPFNGQHTKFAAIIRYFDLKKIRKLLIEYIEDYNLYTFEKDADWDEETRQAYQRKCISALKSLHVLFRDLPHFKNLQAAKSYLEQIYKTESGNAIEGLVQSCEEKLNNKMKVDDGYQELRMAKTRKKLRAAIDPQMSSHSNFTQPALWPLVKQVCIGVHGSRVLDRITIIDLPGVSDTNDVRVNLTKEYLKTCNFIWVVAPISRVIDDSTVWSVVSRYGKIVRGKVMVISTHADVDVNHKLAKELTQQGRDLEAYHRLTKEYKEHTRRVIPLKKKVETLESHQKQTQQKCLIPKNKIVYPKLQSRSVELVEQKRFEALVQARNDYVEDQLQEQLEEHLPPGTKLVVFCVANIHYAALKGAGKVQGPLLSADATGIPALRAHSLTLAAPSLLRTVENYRKHLLQVLLTNAALWVHGASLERRAEILEFAKAPLNALQSRVEARLRTFEAGVEEHLSRGLRAQRSHTRDTAVRIWEKKNQMNASTLRAFIRNDGDHQTKLCPNECWNEQFSRSIIDFIDKRWEAFEAAVKTANDDLMNALIKDIQAIIPALVAYVSIGMLPVNRLNGLVDAQVEGIKHAFRVDDELLARDLGEIRTDVTCHSGKNYFSCTIQPVYHSCRLDSGIGVTKRSMDKILDHLSTESKSPFTTVEQTLKRALIMNDTWYNRNTILKKIEVIFQSTYKSFDNLIKVPAEQPLEKIARLAFEKELVWLNKEYAARSKQMEDLIAEHPM